MPIFSETSDRLEASSHRVLRQGRLVFVTRRELFLRTIFRAGTRDMLELHVRERIARLLRNYDAAAFFLKAFP